MATKDGIELTSHCYCAVSSTEPNMIKCLKCQRYFHMACLKTGSPTTLIGDIFYHLTCTDCAEDGEEEVERMELQWLQVVMLALYNLHMTSAGKCGFFRWKEHICDYIDNHWFTFFGPSRKKTTTWFGTVAGILSSNRPTYFKSGVTYLGESGWWSLAETKPPSMDTFRYQKHLSRSEKREVQQVEGLRRRRTKPTLEAAMELKAKRSLMLDAKEIRQRGKRTRTCVETSDSKADTPGGGRPTPGGGRSTPGGGRSTPDPPRSKGSFSGLGRDGTSPVASHWRLASQEGPGEADSRCVSADPSETESSLDDSHRASEVSGDSSFINTSILSKSSLVESDVLDQDSQMSVTSSNSALWLTERDLVVGDQVPQCLMMEDGGEDDSDLDIDICAITPPASPTTDTDGLPRIAELLSSLSGGNTRTATPPLLWHIKRDKGGDGAHNIKRDKDGDGVAQVEVEAGRKEQRGEPRSSLNTDSESDGQVCTEMKTEEQEADIEGTGDSTSTGRPGNARVAGGADTPGDPPAAAQKYVSLSVYEERLLLKRLQAVGPGARSDPEANRLRRKLLLRQTKRERGLELYDVGVDARSLALGAGGWKLTAQISDYLNHDGLPVSRSCRNDVRVLDRYQLSRYTHAYQTQPVSFLNRLVGSDDGQLQCICSPYTARMLKPFIRRDYESRPRKMRLLEEIRAYPHRNDPTWTTPPPLSVDYCYVRPQHIPTINTICREFFWPGIDLSECLQYPDFSCVVLYRKFIIGFAFMVPDVKYNEAYISFIFTHPEWRGAGVATFMLYHLIQTCMGKDVTLHVSATNSALLLYQRFGFKREQLILDFYDKFYPAESTESRHAFFIRLRR